MEESFSKLVLRSSPWPPPWKAISGYTWVGLVILMEVCLLRIRVRFFSYIWDTYWCQNKTRMKKWPDQGWPEAPWVKNCEATRCLLNVLSTSVRMWKVLSSASHVQLFFANPGDRSHQTPFAHGIQNIGRVAMSSAMIFLNLRDEPKFPR